MQGSTRDVSTSVATAATSRRELYVDITRGRHDNKVYGTINAPPGDTDEHLPTLPRHLVDDLTIAVRRQTPPPVAVADPEALTVVRKRQGRSLAALLAAERRGEPGLYATIERVAATIRQHGEHHPPAQLDALLGPIPASPHLAHRYRALAGNLAVLDAATNAPRRRRPLDVLEQALGVRPAGQAAGAEWDHLADQARQLAVDITVHALRDNPTATDDRRGSSPTSSAARTPARSPTSTLPKVSSNRSVAGAPPMASKTATSALSASDQPTRATGPDTTHSPPSRPCDNRLCQLCAVTTVDHHSEPGP